MPSKNKPIIMVVDDTPANLGILLDVLKEEGFITFIAQSGEGALRQVGVCNPDLILLDILMPGIDGFETCKRLKQDEATREIPVIFMTALTETVDKVRGFEVGGMDYITKPFQQEEVIARIQTQLEMRRQRELLKRANFEKAQLFSIISHDLRSPFSSLRNYAKMLKQELPNLSPDRVEEMVNDLYNGIDRSYLLIESLMNWVGLQRGTMTYRPVVFDISQNIQATIETYRQSAQQKGIRLTSHVTPGIYVYADSDMIDIILRSLVNNAIKFSHPGGIVELQARENNLVEIQVSDQGIGLSDKAKDRIFHVDKRYRQDGTAGETGTGLGLSFCKELISRNGGDIWVESEVNEGATFYFSVPVGEPEPDVEPTAADMTLTTAA